MLPITCSSLSISVAGQVTLMSTQTAASWSLSQCGSTTGPCSSIGSGPVRCGCLLLYPLMFLFARLLTGTMFSIYVNLVLSVRVVEWQVLAVTGVRLICWRQRVQSKMMPNSVGTRWIPEGVKDNPPIGNVIM